MLFDIVIFLTITYWKDILIKYLMHWSIGLLSSSSKNSLFGRESNSFLTA